MVRLEQRTRPVTEVPDDLKGPILDILIERERREREQRDERLPLYDQPPMPRYRPQEPPKESNRGVVIIQMYS